MSRWVVFGTSVLLSSVLATGCTTTATHAGIRAESAKRWECAESAITVTNESPTIVRVRGCGRSAIYVCEAADDPQGPSSQMTMEHEYQTNRGGGCGTWTRQSED